MLKAITRWLGLGASADQRRWSPDGALRELLDSMEYEAVEQGLIRRRRAPGWIGDVGKVASFIGAIEPAVARISDGKLRASWNSEIRAVRSAMVGP